MPCDLEAQNAPAILADDEQTVKHAKSDRWYGEEMYRGYRSPWLRGNVRQRMAGARPTPEEKHVEHGPELYQILAGDEIQI
jgi:hypothetical protein